MLFPMLAVDAAELCPTVFIKEDIDLQLSAVEKRLVCGDDPQRSELSKAWSKIPASQARLSLKGLLQSRGYLNPEFQDVNGVLHVSLGRPTLISDIVLVGGPSWLDINEKRGMIDEKLTPAKLDEVEQWVVLQLRFRGYPCPQVRSTAGENSGKVIVQITTGPEQKITSIEVSDRLGLQEGTLRRYDAFKPGFLFDARDLTITERRILNEDIVASTYFTAECVSDGVRIHHTVVGGPPRSLRIGFGLNTEEYFITRLGLRHARLDDRASLIDFSLQASYRVQQLSGSWKWYYSGEAREYLRPNFVLKREKEVHFETNSLDMGIASGRTWDQKNLSWQFELGPQWRFDNTVVGVGAPSSRSWLADANLQVMTHEFEYYQSSPQTGFRATIDGGLSNKDLGSTVTAQKIFFDSEFLWNYKNYSPPEIVFGIRMGAGTTFTDRTLEDPSLPTIYRYYLGGSQNLRGFGRQELPTNGLGALSYAYSSFETRFNRLLPYQLQPYLFVDVGEVGFQPMSLNSSVYWSPGIGLRWESPIGVLRGNLAKGYVDGRPTNLQLYLSYGEEF